MYRPANAAAASNQPPCAGGAVNVDRRLRRGQSQPRQAAACPDQQIERREPRAKSDPAAPKQ